MPAFYDIDRANARLPELRETLLTLRSLRSELVTLRDRIIALNVPALRGAGELPDVAVGPTPAAGAADPQADEETRRLRMRMQAIVDQMHAAVTQIDSWGVVLRDIRTGLVDFPALVAGRQVWLCWRVGEDEVEWWHELSEGAHGRKPLAALH